MKADGPNKKFLVYICATIAFNFIILLSTYILVVDENRLHLADIEKIAREVSASIRSDLEQQLKSKLLPINALNAFVATNNYDLHKIEAEFDV